MHVNTNPLDILFGAISGAVNTAIARPDVAAQPAAAPAITKEVVAKVAPVVEHLTNNEPWYQSRVTWGAIIAAASPFIAPLIGHALSPEEQALWTSVLTAIGTGLGAALTLYGRYVARKPLGA